MHRWFISEQPSLPLILIWKDSTSFGQIDLLINAVSFYLWRSEEWTTWSTLRMSFPEKKKGCMYELNKLQVVKVWLPDIFCKFLNPYFCWNGVHLKQAAILFMFFKIYIFFYILSFAETSKWKTSCWTKRNLTSRLWVSLNVSLHRFRTWFCHLVTYYLECIISIAMTLPRFP